MFEEMEFKLITSNNEYLSYTKEVIFPLGGVGEIKIVFDLKMHEFYIYSGITKNSSLLFEDKISISRLLLQAINKQVEELGWSD